MPVSWRSRPTCCSSASAFSEDYPDFGRSSFRCSSADSPHPFDQLVGRFVVRFANCARTLSIPTSHRRLPCSFEVPLKGRYNFVSPKRAKRR